MIDKIEVKVPNFIQRHLADPAAAWAHKRLLLIAALIAIFFVLGDLTNGLIVPIAVIAGFYWLAWLGFRNYKADQLQKREE